MFTRSDRLRADGFRVYFTPLLGVLFTFPSRYSSAIGLSGVFSLAGWSPQIRAGFLVTRVTQDPARTPDRIRVRGCHPLWRRFPAASASIRGPTWRSYYPARAVTRAVWAPPRSLATTGGITVVLFSCGYLDVSVPRVRLPHSGWRDRSPAGLPHSDIPGSTAICASPGLFAACHVLHRLREPRHPPSALSHFRLAARGHRCPTRGSLLAGATARPARYRSLLSPTCQRSTTGPLPPVSRERGGPAWRITDSNR